MDVACGRQDSQYSGSAEVTELLGLGRYLQSGAFTAVTPCHFAVDDGYSFYSL